MVSTVKSKFIPTDIVSKTLVGTSSNGEIKELMKIAQVDQWSYPIILDINKELLKHRFVKIYVT